MKFKPVKRIPVLIAFGVILLVSTVRLLRVDFFERLERITYDMRAREALRFSPPVASDLGFVAIAVLQAGKPARELRAFSRTSRLP